MAVENCQDRVAVGRKTLQAMRFAYDQVMLADTKIDLQRIMNRLSTTTDELGMKINV